MNIISGMEPRVVAARKENENFAELDSRIAELEKVIAELKSGQKATVAKKAVKTESSVE